MLFGLLSYDWFVLIGGSYKSPMSPSFFKGAFRCKIDAAYFGGYVKPTNWKENRKPKQDCWVVVIIGARNAITLPFIFESDAQAISTIARRVNPGALYMRTKPQVGIICITLPYEAHQSRGILFSAGACTNQAERLFLRLGRSEIWHIIT